MRCNILCLLAICWLLGAACARAPVMPPESKQANQLCEAKLQIGNLTEALADCDRALQGWPTYTEAWFNRGLIQMYLGQYADARKSFQEVVKRQPDNARAHNDLGILDYQDGALKAAESSFRRALSIKDSYSQARYNLALTLKAAGKLKQAKTELQQLIKQRPEMAEPLHCLGLIRLEEGATSDAIDIFTRVIKLQPRETVFWRSLGYTYAQVFRYEDADYALDSCLEVTPGDALCQVSKNLLSRRQPLPPPRPEPPMP